MGMVSMFGVRGDTEHEKHAPKGMLFVSGMRGGVMVSMFGMRGVIREWPDTKNMSLRTHFSCLV